jgi:hypothetical protein
VSGRGPITTEVPQFIGGTMSQRGQMSPAGDVDWRATLKVDEAKPVAKPRRHPTPDDPELDWCLYLTVKTERVNGKYKYRCLCDEVSCPYEVTRGDRKRAVALTIEHVIITHMGPRLRVRSPTRTVRDEQLACPF